MKSRKVRGLGWQKPHHRGGVIENSNLYRKMESMSFATVWAILKSILVDQIYLKSALAIGVVASTVYAGH